MEIIPGKKIAETTLDEIKVKIDNIEGTPVLAIIMIGDNASSTTYVSMKAKAAKEIGIEVRTYKFNETQKEAIVSQLNKLNTDNEIDGVIIQLPLVEKVFTNTLISQINPEKDVDGLTPLSIGSIWHSQQTTGLGATPLAVIKSVKYIAQQKQLSYKNFIKGKTIVIINHNILIGKPLAGYFTNLDATVIICNQFTKSLEDFTSKADILISGTGKKELIQVNMLKQGAIVIDVGFSKDDSGNIHGDVDHHEIESKVDWLSTVPGGVGPIGVAMLMQNTLEAFLQKKRN